MESLTLHDPQIQHGFHSSPRSKISVYSIMDNYVRNLFATRKTGTVQDDLKEVYRDLGSEEFADAENPVDSEAIQKCSWFHWLQTGINCVYFIQLIPYPLIFDKNRRRYSLRISPFRNVVWAVLNAVMAYQFAQILRISVEKITTSHETALYFDLLLQLGYLTCWYSFKFRWYFNSHAVQEFLDELQKSPLLKLSSPKSRTQTVLFMLYAIWYTSTCFFLLLVDWGVQHWSLEIHYDTLKQVGELYFGIPESWSEWKLFPLVIVLLFIITSQQSGTYVGGEIISISCILTMNRIASDVDKAIRSGNLSDEEVLHMIKAHKKLTKKFNRAVGLMISTCMIYATPYYSLHGVEGFEQPGLINRIFLVTYVGTYAFSLKLCIDLLITVKRRKRWLVANDRLRLLSKSELQLLLDDLTWESFGIGSFYRVNGYVAGEIASFIITVAFIQIGSSNQKS